MKWEDYSLEENIKMILFYKSQKEFLKGFTYLDGFEKDIYYWGKSKFDGSFLDYCEKYGLAAQKDIDSTPANIRLLLKQNPQKVSNSIIDFL